MRFVGRNDLPEVTADPTSLQPGQIWHNTTEGNIKFYDGSTTHIIPYFTDINAPNVGNTTAQWNANQLQGIDIPAATPNDNDILKYNAVSGDWEFVPEGSITPSLTGNVAWVDPVKGDDGLAAVGRIDLPYLTIKAAVDAIVSGQVVCVFPGDYTEDLITIATGKRLVSVGGPNSTSIDGNLATGNRIVLNDGSSLEGFTIKCPNDTTAALHYSGSTAAICKKLFFEGQGASGDCIRADGTGTLYTEDFEYITGTCKSLFDLASGKVVVDRLTLRGGTLSRLFDFSGGELLYSNIKQESSTVTDFFRCSSGSAKGQEVTVEDCTNVIHIVENGFDFTASDLKVESSTYDILVDPGLTGGTIKIADSELSDARFDFPPTWSFDNTILTYLDSTNGDISFNTWGEVAVGLAEKGYELVVGEGDSYTRGMVVYTTDSTATSTTEGGNLQDATSAAKISSGGSTFTFQGTTANHTILIGSTLQNSTDVLKHWGIKVSQANAAVEVSPRSFVFEIWNGSAWVAVPVMVTHSSLFYRYGNEVFIRGNTSEHIRFGIDDSTTWAKKTIDSKNLFWSRIRINTTITTAPVFEQFKLSTSRFEANENGINTFHGLSRFRKTLLGTGNVFGESGSVASDSYAIGTGGLPTGWNHEIKNSLLTSSGDAIYLQMTLPRGVDTSQPLFINVYYKLMDAVNRGTGTLRVSCLPLEAVGVLEADPNGGVLPVPRALANTELIDANVAQVDSKTISLDGTTNKDKVIYLEVYGGFDISNYFEGDWVNFRIELQDDGTNPGQDVQVWGVEVNGVLWTHGERL